MNRPALVTALVGLIAVALGGCSTASEVRRERPAIRPTMAQTDDLEPFRKLAVFRGNDGERVIVVPTLYDRTNLPDEAPNMQGDFEECFAVLAPGRVQFIPNDVLANKINAYGQDIRVTEMPQGRIVAAETRDLPDSPELAAAWVERHPLWRVVRHYTQTDGVKPRIIRMRVRATYDRDLVDVERGARLRALATQQGIYIDGSGDLTQRDTLSVLTISLTEEDDTGTIGKVSVRMEAELLQSMNGTNLGLFIAGSGAGLYERITVAQGLSEGIRAVASHALLVFLAKLMGHDHRACLAPTPIGELLASGGRSANEPPVAIQTP
jgi:hypothetical protein